MARGIGEIPQLLPLQRKIFAILFPPSLWQQKLIVTKKTPYTIPHKSQSPPIAYPYTPVKTTDYKH